MLFRSDLAVHAAGIEDTAAGKAWSDRHANWARQMPKDPSGLWEFVAELDHDSRMFLFAHCTALTVNAVRLPFDRRPRALAAARHLAEAVALDMTGYWRPTVGSYLGRVTKAGILEAVRDGVSEEAAERLSGMKTTEMAAAPEQLLAATGWLPVAGDTSTSAAICLPVWRCRRKASIAVHVARGVWLGDERGLEERSRNPSTPSARKRLTHLATVFGVVLNSSAAPAWLRPPPTTLWTIASRPLGVKGAFELLPV